MRQIIPLAAALLGACTAQPPAGNQALDSMGNDVAPVPANRSAPKPSKPAIAFPTNSAAPAREIVSEVSFAATSAQGAANVVQTYYALIEAKKYVQAHKLWGSSSDLAHETFAAQFERYREYHAQVFAPGEIEGAAGSLYVEVPVRTYGVTTKGEKFEQPGTVTLRRVNDVPGSTAEQRRWHIFRIDTPPSPH